MYFIENYLYSWQKPINNCISGDYTVIFTKLIVDHTL